MRWIIIILLLAVTPMPALGDLPPWQDHHPRLLLDQQLEAALPDSIAADSAKTFCWGALEDVCAIYAQLPPETILGPNSGVASVTNMALTCRLAEEPLATELKAKMVDTARWLISNEGVWGSGDDLTSALRLRALLLIYDTAYDTADDQSRGFLIQEVLDYLAVMTTDFSFTCGIYNPYCSNHGLAIGAALGLAELCLRDELPSEPLLAEARELGDQLIAKGMADLLGEDGSFGEGGLYLSWSFRMLVTYFEAAYRIDGLALWDENKIAAMMEWVAYGLLPEGEGMFLNRNDSSETMRPLTLHNTLWEWAQHRLPDPAFPRWVQDHISGVNGYYFGSVSDQPGVILYRHAGPMIAPAEFLPRHRFFADQGLYVYRKGWPGDPLADSFQFTIQAGKFMGGHWQEDVGHFTLRAFGHTFGLDQGPGSGCNETESHNLPLIAGLGQHNAGSGIGTDGDLQQLSTGGFCHIFKAKMANAYTTHSAFNDPDYPLPGTDWSWGYDGGNPMILADRWLLLFPGEEGEMPEIILYDDLLKDSDPHLYQWRMHYRDNLSLEQVDDLFTISGTEGRMEARLLHPPPDQIQYHTTWIENCDNDPSGYVLDLQHTSVQGQFLWQWNLLPTGEPSLPVQINRFDGGVHLISGELPSRQRDIFWSRGTYLIEEGILLAGRFAILEEDGDSFRSILLEGQEFRHLDRLYFGIQPAGTVFVEGDTVRISKPDLSFEIYAPQAQVVMAGDTPVEFQREGDYVVHGQWTGVPQEFIPTGDRSWHLSSWGMVSGASVVRLSMEGSASAGNARLEVFDISGRRVATLHDGPLAQGRHETAWRGVNDAGRPLASGIYFARLRVGGESVSRRLLILR
jgi:hypothetical protein